jgi:tRNA(adenine34) deaminase
MTQQQLDEQFMRRALEEARSAAEADEVPIGAVVVSPKGAIIGRGHNLTEALNDVTAHAEMQAATRLGGKYLTGCTLYVTVEPCAMCAGAIGWAQISRIVYGAPDPKRGYRVFAARPPFHPRARIEGGLLADEATALLRSFFAARR